MTDIHYDVIVIGAGAAGLMAAWELALTGKKVLVLEARDRIGGRIYTSHDPQFESFVERGAEFIHGKLKTTLGLLKRAGVNYYEIKGEMWQKKDGKFHEQKDFIEDYSDLKKKMKALEKDITVKEFCGIHLSGKKFEELRFTLKNYVEGYYAADSTKASTFALREELTKSDDEQYRIEGGYMQLMNYLQQRSSAKGVTFLLSNPVTNVRWEEDQATVSTHGSEFHSTKILITVPMGVLKSGSIRFSPAIPQKLNAARKLGYGPVIKTILQFEESFWKNGSAGQKNRLRKMGFLFSQENIPTWWTTFPKEEAILTGWSGGPHAERICSLNDNEIASLALQSLSNIFKFKRGILERKLIGWSVTNWATDAYSRGAYSFDVVNGEFYKKQLLTPEAGTLFFAGEGMFIGPEIGTVDAALQVGREVAYNLIASFRK